MYHPPLPPRRARDPGSLTRTRVLPTCPRLTNDPVQRICLVVDQRNAWHIAHGRQLVVRRKPPSCVVDQVRDVHVSNQSAAVWLVSLVLLAGGERAVVDLVQYIPLGGLELRVRNDTSAIADAYPLGNGFAIVDGGRVIICSLMKLDCTH